MADLTLYGMQMLRSGRCQWMLEELGVEYDVKKTTPLTGMPKNMEEYEANATHTDEVMAVNPRGKFPALEDKSTGVVLAESAAINTYLGDMYGDGKIVPKAGTKERGIYDMWCYWCMAELDAQGWWSAYKFSTMGGMYTTEKSDVAVESARRYFLKQIKVASAELKSNGPFLCGANFTAADILLTHNLTMAKNMKWELPDAEVFDAYMSRTTDRPAFHAVYDKKKKGSRL